MEVIISSQPEAAVIALNEIQKIDPKARGKRLRPGVQLVELSEEAFEAIKKSRPIFIQHMGLKEDSIPKFKKDEMHISRAEFKLQEAFLTFAIDLTGFKTALDLGAAPGGWTKVMLEKGLQVTAVDPAVLSDKLNGHPNLIQAKETAQEFLRKQKDPYDILLNDMRMDIMESSKIMLDMASLLKPGGLALMTLKLPHSHWYKNTKRALALLERAYTIKEARQLFHNRSEVTVLLGTP